MNVRLVGGILAALLALAGCFGATADEDAGEALSPDGAGAQDGSPEPRAEAPAGDGAPVPPLRTLFFNGTVKADATGQVSPAFCLGPDACVLGSLFDFQTGRGHAGLVAELKWDGNLDLDLGIAPRTNDLTGGFLEEERYENRDGLPGSPDSLAVVRVEAPSAFGEAREWWAYVTGEAAVNVPFELRITLFTGEVPPDFTAFPGG